LLTAKNLLRFPTLLATLLPLLIAVFLFREGFQAIITVGAGFVLDSSWAPTSGQFNLLPMIGGTVVVSLLAMLLTAPVAIALGLQTALYETPFIRGTLGLMAGIPSVVYGLVALQQLVPYLSKAHPPGLGLGLTALVLACMILPTAALAADAALRAVDPDQVRAARALGLGLTDTLIGVTFPHAWPGIRVGLLGALARAFGETMAVLMVAGNTIAWPTGLFTSFRTLTGTIGLEVAYAQGIHRSALAAIGLVLLGLTSLLIALGGERSR
jgi:phosphate transport system permease protein